MAMEQSQLSIPTLGSYKEMRVDLEPLHPNSIVQIHLPTSSIFDRGLQSAKRRILTGISIAGNERVFAQKTLASSSSVYHRESQKYPRSLLWRTLEHNKVLELRSVDLSKKEQEHLDATIILRLSLPIAIRSGCVAISDPFDGDWVNLFLFTKGNELYTFTLKPHFFFQESATEENIGRWCQVFRPASLSISTPHRLVASSPLNLFAALSDGKLMRLSRNIGSDGSVWQETTYNDGQWGSSLRGLIRWQGSNAARYDGEILDQSTAVAIALSPDSKHVFTVCLNHTLKAWNIETGKVGFAKDLLNQHREPQDISKIRLDPSISSVLRIIKADGAREGDQYYVMTYSPQNMGIFKIWAVRDADEGDRGVCDLFPDYTIRPPDPDPDPQSPIWAVADWHVRDARKGENMKMIVVMRSNRQYKAYILEFDLMNLPERWKTEWRSVMSETIHDTVHRQASLLDSTDASEQWLEHLLRYSLYSKSSIEIALTNFCHYFNIPISITKGSLNKLLFDATEAHSRQLQAQSTSVDSNSYYDAKNQAWSHLWQEVQDLERQRWDFLSLSCDDHSDMPWMLFADGCAAIRDSTNFERLAQNDRNALKHHVNEFLVPPIERDVEEHTLQLPDELHLLIEVAAEFRKSFNYSLTKTCNMALQTEIWQDASFSLPVRIQNFYNKCNFAGEIGSTQYGDLIAALKDVGGFKNFDTEAFFAIFKTLTSTLVKDSSGSMSTKLGLKVLVRGAQEVIHLQTQIMKDLLLLVVFVETEAISHEISMERFDAPRVYSELLDRLKFYETVQWLANAMRREATRGKQPNFSGNLVSDDGKQSVTVLEDLFAKDLAPRAYSMQSQSTALTASIQDLISWVGGGNEPLTLDYILVYIQCNLLVNGNLDLASEFLQFQPSTAWATYVKGRLCLVRGEYQMAAIYFKKAAPILSRPNPAQNLRDMSSNLLSSLEAAYFSTGLSNYHSHILSLFETATVYSYAADFASLALQHTNPSAQRLLHQDLLSRLFHASITISRYDTAYSALMRYSDTVLQIAAISTLVTAMIADKSSAHLLRLPFTGLHNTLDTILAEKAHKTLDVRDSLPYYKILHVWRLQRNDFRGAASILLERLKRLRARWYRSGRRMEKDGVLEEYLVLINVLATMADGKAWVLADGGDLGKRRVVTLEEVRTEYQEELDLRSEIENGRFGIVGGLGEEMEMG